LHDLSAATDNAFAAYRICDKIGLKGGCFEEVQTLLRRLHQGQNIATPFDKWVIML
jgi:hypothetical protein